MGKVVKGGCDDVYLDEKISYPSGHKYPSGTGVAEVSVKKVI